MGTRFTLFDDGDPRATYSSALAAGLLARGASVRRVTIIEPDAQGGRRFERQIEVLACPALATGVRRLRAVVGKLPARVGRLAATATGRVPSVMVWRSLLALGPGVVVVVGAGTPLALGIAREHRAALVIDTDTHDVAAAVDLALAHTP